MNYHLSLRHAGFNCKFFLTVVLFAVSAVYFAGVMVRLMLTLTPVVCVLSGIAFSRLFEVYLKVSIEVLYSLKTVLYNLCFGREIGPKLC